MSRRHDLSNRLESYLTLASPASPYLVTNLARVGIMQVQTNVFCREE